MFEVLLCWKLSWGLSFLPFGVSEGHTFFDFFKLLPISHLVISLLFFFSHLIPDWQVSLELAGVWIQPANRAHLQTSSKRNDFLPSKLDATSLIVWQYGLIVFIWILSCMHAVAVGWYWSIVQILDIEKSRSWREAKIHTGDAHPRNSKCLRFFDQCTNISMETVARKTCSTECSLW